MGGRTQQVPPWRTAGRWKAAPGEGGRVEGRHIGFPSLQREAQGHDRGYLINSSLRLLLEHLLQGATTVAPFR